MADIPGVNFALIPKGWLGCPKSATSLAADLFYTFKTPLTGADFDKELEVEDQWTTNDVLDKAKKLGINLGLWIDLTFTDRYFSPEPITSAGIQYSKFKIAGHGAELSAENLKEFIQLVDGYLKSNPGKHIALHCTHGFNRTGYLIVAYLVEVKGYNVLDAIKEFNRSRGSEGIFRQNYVDILCAKYGGDGVQVPIVSEPEWAKGLK